MYFSFGYIGKKGILKMKLVSQIPRNTNSAFSHRLTNMLKKTIKKDSGAIPNKDSASWYEHIVVSNDDGDVCAEAYVLLIAPPGRFDEGQDKWIAISDSVRGLLADGKEVRSLERGHARGYSNQSNLVFPELDETVPPIQKTENTQRR